MNEHDDDVEPEVDEGEVEIEEFPIAGDEEDDEIDYLEDEPDVDPDKSEI